MKRVLVFSVVLLYACLVQAQSQPWLKNFNNGPIKLQDVIDEWNSTHHDGDDEERNNDEEDENYQFDRWVNYWKAHLDADGYIVSPYITVREWSKYLQHAGVRNARTTGTPAWSFEGPKASTSDFTNGRGLGRIASVAYHPTDTNTFWVGTAGGGAWKTIDGGKTWACMTDNSIYPIRAVSDIVINPLNPNTIYLCTGDRDGKDCYSFGVLKSYNGGATWDTTGVIWTESSGKFTNSMVMNKLDTNVLILATSDGLFKSTDAGKSFTFTQIGTFTQVVYNTADTNVLYAAGSYGASTNIYRSADGGNTWSPTSGISNAIRIAMAVTPQNAGIVKAVAANSAYGLEGVYSSSDSGKTFNRIYNADTGCSLNILANDPRPRTSSCGGQGWYDLCIAMSPLDSNSVYIGGVNTWHSTTGGRTWPAYAATQWTNSVKTPPVQVVHADKHYMGYNPIAPNYIYEGNDGGIYRSAYRATPDTLSAYLYYDLTNGLGITQFYRIAVTDNAPFVLGGAQDNGTKLVIADTVAQPGGADGMTCQIDYTNYGVLYISSQYGSISRSTDTGRTSRSISRNISSPAPTGAWTTPFIIDPVDHLTLYAGYNTVYVSKDSGGSWSKIAAYPSGTNIDRIAISATDRNYMYVLVGNIIRYTIDGGTTWKFFANPYGTASDIAIDPTDPTNIWVVYNGFTTNKVAFYSLATAKWTLQNGTLPAIPLHCITIDKDNSTMYVGSDVGVFYRDKFMSDWALYNNGLPVVQVNDLKINYATGELWAGTYGRGMWKTAKAGPAANISIVPYAADVVTVSPNPNAGHFNVNTSNKLFFNKGVSVKLINGLGQIVWQGKSTFDNSGKLSINTSGVATGPYIFEVTDAATTARTKVIITQ